MSFPWLDPQVSPAFHASLPQRRNEMHKTEIAERARLLMRLGRTHAQTVANCKSYVQWEYEGLPSPSVLKDIDAIVGAVYARR